MNAQAPVLRQQGTARQLVVNGNPLILLSGELHNSSSSSLAYMEPIWPRMVDMGLNSLIVPLYWELVEPEEGRFDFTLLDGLVIQARQHGLHLVFLWFGTWKNAVSCYVPGWVKADLKRFPRMQFKPGANNMTISCFSTEARDCDARAYAAVMRRIREIDLGHHTVVMMQVENETGLLGAPRDWSDTAQRAFDAAVPAELIASLTRRRNELLPETREAWARSNTRPAGTWTEVFGDQAAEIFMAWHMAQFIGTIVAAGRKEYDIPMYVNAWLKQKGMDLPGQYPSGGPVSGMMDIWRAAAPAIDFFAPDIYVPCFKEVCASYARSGNPLFIPEAWNDERAASAVFYALGQHDAIGFGPFAIDDLQAPHPLAESYGLLREMLPFLTQYQGTGRMAGFYQERDDELNTFQLGGYQVRAGARKALQPKTPPGGGLVVAIEEPDTFIVAGREFWVDFRSPHAPVADTEFLWLEQGQFKSGKWQAGRRLNGDETMHGTTAVAGDKPIALRLKLNRRTVPIYQANHVM